MKPGDLVRYARFPHEELHADGMTGLILAGPWPQGKITQKSECQVNVMWCKSRYHADMRGGNITWEYLDELEVLHE